MLYFQDIEVDYFCIKYISQVIFSSVTSHFIWFSLIKGKINCVACNEVSFQRKQLTVQVLPSSAGLIIVRCRILFWRYWPLQENLWSLQERCCIPVYCRNHGCCRIFMVSGGNLQQLQENNGRCRNLSQLSQNHVLCRKNFNFANTSRFFISKASVQTPNFRKTLFK